RFAARHMTAGSDGAPIITRHFRGEDSWFRNRETYATSLRISLRVNFLPNAGMPPLPLVTIAIRLLVLVMLECVRHQSGSVKSGVLYVCPRGVSPAPSTPRHRAQLFLKRSATRVPADLVADRLCRSVALLSVKLI